MKSSLAELIRSAFGPKDEKFRQRFTIFLVCLLISIIIWFSIKLANEFNAVIEMPLTFTNIPKNKSLVGMSDSLIQVEIVEKGSDLFRMTYLQKPGPATISLKGISLSYKNGVYEGIVIPSTFISDIEHEHDFLGKIITIKPDTIFLTFENQSSRKLPVKASLDLTFEKEYMLYGNILLEPDSVMVKGPARIMEKLDSADLGVISYQNLRNNMVLDKRFPYDSSHYFLDFSPQVIKVTIPVEKYTESEIDADILVINNQDYRIKTFPDKVRIYYNIALKDYSRADPGMISAVADFSNVNVAADDRVKIRIEHHPEFIQINKIEPEKVEFIIIK